MTATNGEYTISTDKSKMDVDFIHQFLSTSYWAEGITKDTIARSIEGSLCFGIFNSNGQVGFARVITDQATFAYLADVFIVDGHRGKGLSRWLLEYIFSQPSLQGLRRILL